MKETLSSRSDTPPIPASNPNALRGLFSGIALFIGVVTTLLALLGYGVSYSAESLFGIPHGLFIGSVFDCIDLASVALLQMFTESASVIEHFPVMLEKLYASLLFPFIVPLSLVIATVYLFRKNGRQIKRHLAQHKIKERLIALWKKPSLIRFCAVIAVLSAPAIGALFLIWLWLVAILAVAVVPLIGYTAADAHMKKWVIGADACTPSFKLDEMRALTQSTRQSQRGSPRRTVVPCASVYRDKETLARGRVVLGTSKAIALYDPGTGKVVGIPLGSGIMTVVDNLQGSSDEIQALPGMDARPSGKTSPNITTPSAPRSSS